MKFDPLTAVMIVVLAVLVIFMFRNSRKRKAMQEELQSKVQVGARVMTNGGIFGTIIDMDEENNEVKIETHPGTILTVHRQTVGRVVDPIEQQDEIISSETIDPDVSTTDPATPHSDIAPEYGERADSPRKSAD